MGHAISPTPNPFLIRRLRKTPAFEIQATELDELDYDEIKGRVGGK